MNKIKEFISRDFGNDKRIKALVLIGIAAVIVIVLSESNPSKTQEKKSTDNNEYYINVEKETEELISSISGVGRCKVMITFNNSVENVYAINSEENSSDGSNSLKSEYIFYDGQEGENPVLIKQYFPKVKGVAIVCDGADNISVRESVINAVSSLFGVPVNKISVTKYKG